MVNPKMTLTLLFGLSALPILAAQLLYVHYRNNPRPASHTVGQLQIAPVAAADQHWRLQVEPDCSAGSVSAQRLEQAQRIGRSLGAKRALPVLAAAACRNNGPAGLTLVDPRGNSVLFYSAQQLDDPQLRKAVLAEIGQVLRNNPITGERP
ncbi:hypothetical protein [Chitinilyticum piscinae]|uniref:Uncharacterized protein n=1 Tax=Chitinilyticum piscinae TaxID=2866724 RepID=A0A8J7FJF6_9NEIS|nr:hypothetical protein [Chitinilyticum piscinae]MBE9610495.1 hypothetical protein [Chitinilyticum piscinae]